jgi:hypothetical protein
MKEDVVIIQAAFGVEMTGEDRLLQIAEVRSREFESHFDDNVWDA